MRTDNTLNRHVSKTPRTNERRVLCTLLAGRRLEHDHQFSWYAAAASGAKVSRATAYRYFPTQQALLIELGAERSYEHVEQLLAAMASPDVEERLVSLIGAYKEAFEHDEPRIPWPSASAKTDGSGPIATDRPPRRACVKGGACAGSTPSCNPLALPEDRRQLLKTVLALTAGPTRSSSSKTSATSAAPRRPQRFDAPRSH
jgi:AcrR family transcriptional regulator